LRVVVDANVAVSLTIDPVRAAVIAQHLREWERARATLYAPALFRYEVASALTRGVVAGELSQSDATLAWDRIIGIPIVLHDLHAGPAVIEIARQLRRQSAYDAAYIALAQQLDAEVWTLDGPLARNAAGSSLPVRLIEVAPSRKA
jgi:predicted nucleic acid-binding protein